SVVELASPVVEQAAPDGAAELIVRRRRLGGAGQKADRGQQRSDARADRRDRELADCFQHSLHRIRLLNIGRPTAARLPDLHDSLPFGRGPVPDTSASISLYSCRFLRASPAILAFPAGSIRPILLAWGLVWPYQLDNSSLDGFRGRSRRGRDDLPGLRQGKQL